MTKVRRDVQLNEFKTMMITDHKDTSELTGEYQHIYTQLREARSSQKKMELLDTLSIIILKLTKATKSEEKCPQLQIDSELVQFLFLNLDNSNKTKMNTIIANTLNKMVGYSKLQDDFETQILKWVQILADSLTNSKHLLNMMETLVKNITTNVYPFYKANQAFVLRLLEFFKSSSLANSSSKVLTAIFANMYQTDSSRYFDSWDELIYSFLISQDHSKNMVIYLMPAIFKIDQNSFSKFLLKFFINFEHSNDDFKIQLGLSLLKIGETMSIDSSSIISVESLQDLLTFRSLNVRLNYLEFLCFTAKPTSTISSEVFSLIQNNLDSVLFDLNSVDTRNQFINTINGFLIHVRDSSYTRNKSKDIEYVNSSEQFLKWFLGFIQRGLLPSSSYAHNFIALSFSNKLIDLNLDGFTGLNKNNKSSFPFKINVFTDTIIVLLLDNLNNEYDDIRDMSCKVLLRCHQENLTKLLNYYTPEKSKLISKATRYCFSLRSRRSDGGANYFNFLALYFVQRGETQRVYELVLYLSQYLLHTEQLVGDFSTEESRHHGICTALKFVLQALPASVFDENVELWSTHFGRLLKLFQSMWPKLKPFLSNSKDNEDEEVDISQEQKLASNFSWRFIKESTDLVNTIFKINSSKFNLVEITSFLDYIEVLIDQISNINHKGALSAIYPSFVLIISYCCTNPNTREHPEVLLKRILCLIESKSQLISRRSGGLPLLITGILTGCKGAYKNCDALMTLTFKSLFATIKLEVGENENKYDLPQVNAMNCVKAIVNDSLLREESSQYWEESLNLCLLYFGSHNWSVRNCGLMLFTSLNNKLFNKAIKPLSTRIFENYELKHTLLKYLDSNNVEWVFPILSIISNLNFVNDEETLEEFEVGLIPLLGDRNWKVREMTSRTLSEISLPSLHSTLVSKLVSLLDTKDKNFNHGIFLCLLEIVKLKQLEAPEQVLLPLIKYQSWSTLKTYIDIIRYLDVPESCKTLLSHIFVKNISPEFSGLKRLALNNLLVYLLHVESSENVNNLINICFDLCFDFTVIVLDFLNKSVENFDTSSVWKILETSNDILITRKALEVLGKYPSSEYNGEHIKTLYRALENESNDIKAASLHVLSNYCSEHIKNFLNECIEFTHEDMPESIRMNGLKSIINYLAPCSKKSDKYLKFVSLTFSLATDKDIRIREMACEFICQLLEYPYSRSCYAVFKDFPLFLARDFESSELSSEIAQQLVNIFAFTKENLVQFEENWDDENALFDLEEPNTYRNGVIIVQTYIQVLQSAELSRSSIQHLTESSISTIDHMIGFFDKFQNADITGYTSNMLVFSSLEQNFTILKYAKERIQDPTFDQSMKILREKCKNCNIHQVLQSLL
ncbi:hypothetical protein CANTEDRAFT_96309 [Yamadazyma tenuis ATCC 10573]|uniref:Uncharacterized protein n=1 Tax=Candida tenuis (strain ATCC 10573 / BCRC 21748 / CBS 615 / JCM 9827 / NBRC 10315 / NRRL Y-1498 / VKM Y-70) TaxID=590646 RepID=G3BCS1_CANTC|nr:uncharacterized protein CANTEDRAFT_96309 [Yamadazyma tenuis ATCC 10573]EGV60868.1 hypothetical protein CANTEDRAFT_96309 [Yamadazyma tenuis ATCC 10573]